jgi:FtsZ-binding cell division protein ZapB
LEKEFEKSKKHSALLQSKLDGAFAQYHNEVQEVQAKRDDLIRKNKSLCQKNKGMFSAKAVEYLLGYLGVVCHCIELSADLEARVDQLEASEMNLKNIVYRETDAREVLEYEFKKLSHVKDRLGDQRGGE